MNEKRESGVEISVVVPVYNEEENLGPLDAEIRDALARSGRSAEIVYVDDGSRDGSYSRLAELASASAGTAYPTRVVRLRRNYGQSAAMAAGFGETRGRIIVPLDADRQNNPADIPRLADRLDEGFDVVSGWRRDRQDKVLSRVLPSRIANGLINRLSGLGLHDHGCTVKAYRADLLRDLRIYGDMHRFLPVYLAAAGARITELEVDHRPRVAGSSKYGVGRVVPVALDLVLVFFMSRYYARPMHFFGKVSLLFFLLLALVTAAMVVFKYGWLRLVGIEYQASFVETPLPALAGSLLVGAVSSLFFGILGEILVRIHYETQGRSPYAIERILDSEEVDTTCAE